MSDPRTSRSRSALALSLPWLWIDDAALRPLYSLVAVMLVPCMPPPTPAPLTMLVPVASLLLRCDTMARFPPASRDMSLPDFRLDAATTRSAPLLTDSAAPACRSEPIWVSLRLCPPLALRFICA